MSLQNFPKAQPGELLGNVLARSAHQLGLAEDKTVLEVLFGSHNIVPSALLQGHIWQLLSRVGHIWQTSPEQLLQEHSILPVFRPFIDNAHYQSIQLDLISAKTNPASFRSGINASIIRWPTHYLACPVCWHEQKQSLGFTYWQRLFQCPGVDCCPVHQCRLVTTTLPLQPSRRHHITCTHEAGTLSAVSLAASDLEIQLSRHIQQLMEYNGETPDIKQWSNFYSQLAKELSYIHKGCIDHQRIRSKIVQHWGIDWLDRHGLTLEKENNWLLAMFRQHRRAFSYLQHLTCWMALIDRPFELQKIIEEACFASGTARTKRTYTSPNAERRKDEYRQLWMEQLKQFETLKEIRATREGSRIHSWLYRYDQEWLMTHKLPKLRQTRTQKVDWLVRDKQLVRSLLYTKCRTDEVLELPRKSVAWYAQQVQARAIWDRHKQKLPLCRAFMARYAESIDEYQARRLVCVMIRLIKSRRNNIARSEIERIVGINKERCRRATRRIIECDLPTWQSYQEIPNQHQA